MSGLVRYAASLGMDERSEVEMGHGGQDKLENLQRSIHTFDIPIIWHRPKSYPKGSAQSLGSTIGTVEKVMTVESGFIESFLTWQFGSHDQTATLKSSEKGFPPILLGIKERKRKKKKSKGGD